MNIFVSGRDRVGMSESARLLRKESVSRTRTMNHLRSLEVCLYTSFDLARRDLRTLTFEAILAIGVHLTAVVGAWFHPNWAFCVHLGLARLRWR